jgi:(S)-sulfolactate dehydrogenase
MLAESDIVSVHVPMTPGTRNILDAAGIRAMPRGAFVVNTARGGLIDEDALVAALRDGHIGGAVLDVMDGEPLAAGNRFVGVPNVILSPHVSGITKDANMRASLLTAENVRLALEGRSARVANAAQAAPA